MSAALPIERGARLAVVVMGVSGSGKTTLGAALGRALHLEFVDGDDLHPPHNLAKMRSGRPLDDDDRRPWLEAVAAVLADDAGFAAGVVVACSSLRRAYRERLRRAAPVRFVFLDADRPLIEGRFAGRRDHVLPRELIASQFLALERPAASEADVLTLDAAAPLESAVQAVVEFLDASQHELSHGANDLN